jgi:hypothetical protein
MTKGPRDEFARAIKTMAEQSLKMSRALEQPDEWDSLDPDTLTLLAFVRFTRNGSSAVKADSADLRRLYQVLLQRLSPHERLNLKHKVCQYATEGHTGVYALLPFLEHDSDRTVLSSATIDWAMLMPRVNGDPLTGPRHLMHLYEHSAANTALRLGLMTGLVLLGDERLLPLLKGRWRDFARDDRNRLAASSSGFVMTLQIEFLLDWLENTDNHADVGAIAGAMCQMPGISQVGHVLRVQRCFPASDASEGDEISLLERWTFAEYATRIEPRLSSLIAKEAYQQVIPEILAAWNADDDEDGIFDDE